LYSCPNRHDYPYFGYAINVNSSNDDYSGSPTPPGNWFDGRCGQPPNPRQGTVALAGLVALATTIWYHESVPGYYQDGLNTWADLEADASGGGDPSLQIDGSETIARLFITGGAKADNDSLIHEPMRHSQGMNIGWCDGHAKWLKPSAIKGEWWNIEQIPQPVETGN
jgi:prepilin-type processing-associated H-X9-DG protein